MCSPKVAGAGRVGVVVALLGVLLLAAACGNAQTVSISRGDLGLGGGPTARPLATTTLYTTPDGGIYENPDHVDVLFVGSIVVQPLLERLGGAEWGELAALGRFAVVGLRIRNDGEIGSEPVLDDLQIASDFAPPQAATGRLRRFYHPMFPLALLADRRPTGNCTVHLDPGEVAVVLLVYPPIRPSSAILWGRYDDLRLTLPVGGSMATTGTLEAERCTPPAPPPVVG
jgi:hypothetical protein